MYPYMKPTLGIGYLPFLLFLAAAAASKAEMFRQHAARSGLQGPLSVIAYLLIALKSTSLIDRFLVDRDIVTFRGK